MGVNYHLSGVEALAGGKFFHEGYQGVLTVERKVYELLHLSPSTWKYAEDESLIFPCREL